MEYGVEVSRVGHLRNLAFALSLFLGARVSRKGVLVLGYNSSLKDEISPSFGGVC